MYCICRHRVTPEFAYLLFMNTCLRSVHFEAAHCAVFSALPEEDDDEEVAHQWWRLHAASPSDRAALWTLLPHEASTRPGEEEEEGETSSGKLPGRLQHFSSTNLLTLRGKSHFQERPLHDQNGSPADSQQEPNFYQVLLAFVPAHWNTSIIDVTET